MQRYMVSLTYGLDYEEGLREGGAAVRRYSPFFVITGATVLVLDGITILMLEESFGIPRPARKVNTP